MIKISFTFWIVITSIMFFTSLYLKKEYPNYEFNDFFDDYLAPWFIYSILVLLFNLFI